MAALAGDARAASADACSATDGQAVRIAAVAQDWSVVLDDGRAVRLAGIDPVASTARFPALAQEGRDKLSAWLGGRPAVLRPVGAGTDRWGRIGGLLFAGVGSSEPAAPAPLSVALALVDAGLARGRPDPGVPQGCWAAILAAERAARTAGLGLWADPAYAVLHPGQADALAAAVGTMVLVEARVARVGTGRTRLFIDMGADRSSRVTASIAKRDLFILDQLGLNGARLVGTTILVRGDLEERAGYSIDVGDPAAIEVLDEPARRAEAQDRVPEATAAQNRESGTER